MNNKIQKTIQLFLTFIKIGAFTFGGGYAMLPLIQKEIVEKKHWITDNDILEIVAISESTPGPIAINAATFVGFRICGFWGALFATLGVVIPSYLIILIISFVLKEFQSIKIIQYAFNGIRALWSMYIQCPKNIISYIIMACSFIFTALLNVNVLIVIISCAILGLVTSITILRRKC